MIDLTTLKGYKGLVCFSWREEDGSRNSTETEICYRLIGTGWEGEMLTIPDTMNGKHKLKHYLVLQEKYNK